jgi:hypothetical protein
MKYILLSLSSQLQEALNRFNRKISIKKERYERFKVILANSFD